MTSMVLQKLRIGVLPVTEEKLTCIFREALLCPVVRPAIVGEDMLGASSSSVISVARQFNLAMEASLKSVARFLRLEIDCRHAH